VICRLPLHQYEKESATRPLARVRVHLCHEIVVALPRVLFQDRGRGHLRRLLRGRIQGRGPFRGKKNHALYLGSRLPLHNTV
jgi:hypothetical protein